MRNRKFLARTENGSTYTITYGYDTNGNQTSKVTPAHNGVSTVGEILRYNSFDQLTSLTINSTSSAYAYNAQGIRTVAKTGSLRTVFLLDGGNVVCEIQNGGSIQSYLRGINLIRRKAGTVTDYYLFNAHGDVVNLVNNAGVVTQSYDYDAFGVEQDPDPLDTNHFRYCGEYLDAETGRYYLRARYYDPLIGRFTQRDTHWNTANMIYGDNPQKINEREDKLGLKTYSYAPQITAIMQAGNLYVYALNNPLAYCDPTGNSATLIIAAGIFLFGTLGGLTGMQLADAAGATGWEKALYVGVGTLIGGIGGYALATAAIPATVATAGVGASVSASAVAAGPVGSLGTTILGSWQAAEAYIRQTYDAVKHTFHNVPSGMSARIVDGYNESSGIIYEVKYGYAALSQFVQTEIQRDIHLIQNGVVKGVEWHFFISQVTGKGGPSTPLLDALLEAGIKVVFH